MENICDYQSCTGCGMCTNICPVKAIQMKEGINHFIFPKIDQSKCIDCGLCIKRCPANEKESNQNDVKNVYAAWNKDKTVRSQSSSGGVFTLLAKKIIECGGVVVGCSWTEEFHVKHIMIERLEDIYKLRGSKYVQSEIGDIYKRIKDKLNDGKIVLFSGTPCQNHALKNFLGKNYDKLYQIDLVCHGVPSNNMWMKYLKEINKDNKCIKNISLRRKEKDKYWDYPFVSIKYKDGSEYNERTLYDPYFNLFNVGYSLRESCHHCKYTSTYRTGDITLADFWAYKLKKFKMRDYQKGISLILINSNKGEELFELLKGYIIWDEDTLQSAKNGNKCLSKPFEIDEIKQAEFWEDYNGGKSIENLDEKYTKHVFKLPNLLALRRIKNRFRWLKQ